MPAKPSGPAEEGIGGEVIPPARVTCGEPVAPDLVGDVDQTHRDPVHVSAHALNPLLPACRNSLQPGSRADSPPDSLLPDLLICPIRPTDTPPNPPRP